MSDTSGPMWPQPLARWDRDSSSWRTSPDTSLWDLPMSLGTLPRWGMTHGGELFELPTPALPAVAPASSSLPTPTARDWKEQSPTFYYRDGVLQEDLLPRAIWQQVAPEMNPALLPTPTVMDMGANYTPQEWEAWKARQKAAHANGNGHGASLTQEAISLLPTPRAQDEYERRNMKTMLRIRDEGGDMTLPTWAKVVAPSIGAATPPPSDAGNTSSDGQHQPPLFPARTGDPDSPPASSSG